MFDWTAASPDHFPGEKAPQGNFALISCEERAAPEQARRMMEQGMHVCFLRTTLPLEEEIQLKKQARQKGLLLLGPGCGCQILSGCSIGYVSPVQPGTVAIVSSTGTAIQELTAVLDRLQIGVSHALGAGERDLSIEVGGLTTMEILDALEQDASTEIVIVAVKSVAGVMRDRLIARLSNYQKPVITVFLGERPEVHSEGFYHADTLEEAAQLAACLLRGESLKWQPFPLSVKPVCGMEMPTGIRADYASGTLAKEAAMMLRDALRLPVPLEKQKGCLLQFQGHCVADWSDSTLYRGDRHPKLEYAKRLRALEEAGADPRIGVLLMEVYLGDGFPQNPSALILPVWRRIEKRRESMRRQLQMIVHLCGTAGAAQNFGRQQRRLEAAGIVVCHSNRQAVAQALDYVGYSWQERKKPVIQIQRAAVTKRSIPQGIRALLERPPEVFRLDCDALPLEQNGRTIQ